MRKAKIVIRISHSLLRNHSTLDFRDSGSFNYNADTCICSAIYINLRTIACNCISIYSRETSIANLLSTSGFVAQYHQQQRRDQQLLLVTRQA